MKWQSTCLAYDKGEEQVDKRGDGLPGAAGLQGLHLYA